MEKETLVQVRNYLIERRADALQYSEVETKEIDPVMLDLARIVVEDKIRDLEPKQGVEDEKVNSPTDKLTTTIYIDAGDFKEMIANSIEEIKSLYVGKEGHIFIENGVIKANKETCLGLCELSIPKQFSEELEKIEIIKERINSKARDMTLRDADVKNILLANINCNEQILHLIDRYNKGLNMIKELVDRKTEDAIHQS